MQAFYRMTRYALPVLFFGYAPFANLSYLKQPGDLAPFDMGVLQGTLTRSFDTAYKSAMPHRVASIGLIGAGRYVLMGEGRKGVLGGRDGWLFTAEEARLPGNGLDTGLSEIVAIKTKLADAGVELIVVPLPAKIDVHAAQALAPRLSGQMGGLYASFVRGLKAADVSVVDARVPMLDLAATQPAFFATDTHWTVEGARAVARAVADSGLVTAQRGEMVTRALPQKTIAGDLVSYVTNETLAPYIGLPRETLAPYEVAVKDAAGIGDLFGAASVEVVLVGTSYSANPDWSFAEALKLELQTDVLNAAAQGLGPVKPMRDYLASDTFRERPPTVVIWEFPLRYLTDPMLWEQPSAAVEVASVD